MCHLPCVIIKIKLRREVIVSTLNSGLNQKVNIRPENVLLKKNFEGI